MLLLRLLPLGELSFSIGMPNSLGLRPAIARRRSRAAPNQTFDRVRSSCAQMLADTRSRVVATTSATLGGSTASG